MKIILDKVKKTDDLDEIVKQYATIASEFWSYIDTINFDNKSPKYIEYRDKSKKLTELILKEFDFKLNNVYIVVKNYSVDKWGHLFWNMFHLSSILVQDLLYKYKIENTDDFTTFMFCVYEILPCPICLTHYQSALQPTSKFFPRITQCLNECAFGYTISSAYTFHNLISENITSQSTDIKQYFPLNKFRGIYKCLPIIDQNVTQLTSIIRSPVLWVNDAKHYLAYGLVYCYSVTYLFAIAYINKLLDQPVPYIMSMKPQNETLLQNSELSTILDTVKEFYKTKQIPEIIGIEKFSNIDESVKEYFEINKKLIDEVESI